MRRLAGFTLPTGILVEYAYDAASRVTGITYKQNGTTVLGNLTYEYNKAGNRTKIGGSFARTGVPQTINSTAYNAANHQTSFGDMTLTYDNNGNLTSIVDTSGTTLYSWNARNELTGISGPGVNASFMYDGLGRREKKTINSSLTEFLYDGVNPVQETSGATVLANTLPGLGLDEFFSRTDVAGALTSHLLPDGLGSTLALTDSAGTVQTEYTYEPFGRTTLTGAANNSSYQYTGRENDGTGLHYYRARYYHPHLQRFIAEDPIAFYGNDINLYGYVFNRPTSLIDPLGLYPGEYPPPPPGYEPGTWKTGQWDNGKWFLKSPDGRVYTAHPEDKGHWRHWDIQGPTGKDQGQWPKNPGKPWPNQKRPSKSGQSAEDPSGNAPEWRPPGSGPIPFSPLDPFGPPRLPFRVPFRIPVPVW